jgi:hypothetical protein
MTLAIDTGGGHANACIWENLDERPRNRILRHWVTTSDGHAFDSTSSNAWSEPLSNLRPQFLSRQRHPMHAEWCVRICTYFAKLVGHAFVGGWLQSNADQHKRKGNKNLDYLNEDGDASMRLRVRTVSCATYNSIRHPSSTTFPPRHQRYHHSTLPLFRRRRSRGAE